MKYRRMLSLLIIVIISLVSLFSILFILDTIYKISFFVSYHLFLYAMLLVAGGVIITNLIASLISKKTSKVVGKSTAGTLSFTIRIVGYLLIVAVFFTFVRVNVGAALAAGGFAGLVLGLASQYVLSNIFGGIAMVGARPFKIGDRITFSTWQYGMVAPAYPPKFYSTDFLIPGYTGVITDISLMYTSMITDDNVPVKIPNSIMIQSAIFLQSRNNSRMVRTKFEVSKDLDPDVLIPALRAEIKKFDFIVNEADIHIYETTLTTYIMVVQAMCKTTYEEHPRSEILKLSIHLVKNLTAKKNNN